MAPEEQKARFKLIQRPMFCLWETITWSICCVCLFIEGPVGFELNPTEQNDTQTWVFSEKAHAANHCPGVLIWTTDFIRFISRTFCTVLWTHWRVVKQAAQLLSTNWWTKETEPWTGWRWERSCPLTTSPIWTLRPSLFPGEHSLKATDQHSDRDGDRAAY